MVRPETPRRASSPHESPANLGVSRAKFSVLGLWRHGVAHDRAPHQSRSRRNRLEPHSRCDEAAGCQSASLRRYRLRGRVTRWQQADPETIEWEKQHAIEVDVLKSHRCKCEGVPAINQTWPRCRPTNSIWTAGATSYRTPSHPGKAKNLPEEEALLR